MTRSLLALLLVAAAIPCAYGREALEAIDDCLAKLDPAVDVGYARIAQRCPELTPALTQSPGAAWLPADWNRPDNELSANGLAELRTLLGRESAPLAATRLAPRVAHVSAVLAAVTQSDEVRGNRWTRFKDWLRRLLAPPPRASDDSWVRRWFASIDLSRNVAEIITWTALALIVALALMILLNELRIAGVLKGREPPTRGQASASAREQMSLEEIERAETSQRPGLLLNLIATRLAEEDRLPPARAFTARELTLRARLPDKIARQQLAELASVCERVRFSGASVPEQSVAAALRSGRGLLARLDAAVAAAPATA